MSQSSRASWVPASRRGVFASVFRGLGALRGCAWLGAMAWLAWSASLSAVNLPPLWRWSNPLPHGASIYGMAYSDGLYVQVGEGGQIFTSEDGDTWTPGDSHTSLALRSAAFYNGLLVITGEEGTILVTDDAVSFYTVSQTTTDWLEGVAVSSNLVVAVGDNGAVYTSTNAVDWKRVTVSFTQWLSSVACNTNTFVAVGERGFIATSPNGTTWTLRSSGTTTNLCRVAWLGDRFVAVGAGGKAFTSARGDTWTALATGATNDLYAVAGTTNSTLLAGQEELRLRGTGGWSNELAATLTAPAPVWSYYAALWDGTRYLAAGATGLQTWGTKTNSVTRWTDDTNSYRTWLWQAVRTGSNYVAVGNNGLILTSPDGIDWDLELTPSSATNAILLGVGGKPNFTLAAGSGGAVLWSTNLYTWKAVSPAPTTNDLKGVWHDGSRFLLCGGNGTILASANGTNWTARASPTTEFLMSFAQFPGGYVAVGSSGTILTSADTTNWVRQTAVTTNWLCHVHYTNGWLLASGENGTLLASTNGVRWTARTTGVTAWLNAIEYVSGVWFIAGNQGTMLVSTDSTNWTRTATLTSQSLYGLASHNGRLVTVGSEGVIMRSLIVPPSTPVAISRYSRSSGQNLFLFSGQPDQQFYLQNSSAFTSWTNSPLLEFGDSSGVMLYLQSAVTNPPPKDFYRTGTAY